MGWRKRRQGNGKRTKTKVDGQRKWNPKKKSKGEHKREDTKGKAQAKKITKMTKVRVLYWNVAGLRTKKEEEFWDYARQLEIVGLVETWVEEPSWEKVLLPKEYNWECQGAKRGKKKDDVIHMRHILFNIL
ncbi:hypothetical protein MTP99_001658 [Tenebrio molitor]|jgi:hypothetical protein|nr:hypothetical protein MTP99_001658 [Tenebrio molitor]